MNLARIICLCVLGLASTPALPAVDEDFARIIVQLKPVASGSIKIQRNNSGRPDFDRRVTDLQIVDVTQVVSPSQTPAQRRALATSRALHDFVIVRVPAGSDPQIVRERLLQSPDVLNAQFDPISRADGAHVTPNDTHFSGMQYGLANTGTQPPWDPGTIDADIDMDAAWAYSTGDSATILAIIDTGVDTEHPEFATRIWENPGEVVDDEDNDGNGLVDDAFGWNFNADNNAINDDHGHGTHCAGIAGATGNNGVGIAGINWLCRIMPIKVLDGTGSGSTSDVVAGIIYATDKGADVISLSLGHSGAPVPIEDSAISYARANGVIVVAAMGNDNIGTTHYPSAYDSVISVGATDSDDNRARPFCYSPASGSNYGHWIDVCAPGDNVYSTHPAAFGNYANLCGTSMATPHVSGLVSVMLALRPNWPLDSVQRLLRVTAEDQVGRPSEDTPGFDLYHGWGRVNAHEVLKSLAAAYPPIVSVPGPLNVTEADTLNFQVSAFDSNYTTLAISMESLPNASLIDAGNGNASVQFAPDYSQAGIHVVQIFASDGVFADTAEVSVTVANGCQCPCHADPACDGNPDVLDVVNTINVAFRGGSPTFDTDCFPNPGGRTDVDCTGAADVLDVVKMIDAAFRGVVPAFCDPCSL